MFWRNEPVVWDNIPVIYVVISADLGRECGNSREGWGVGWRKERNMEWEGVGEIDMEGERGCESEAGRRSGMAKGGGRNGEGM